MNATVSPTIEKRFATAQAHAAMRGYELRALSNAPRPDSYIISRWNLSRELPDLEAVDRFLCRAAAGAQE